MEIGKNAPTFSLKDKDRNNISLNDIKEDYVVVYFYPKDNTPGCTTEAIEFSADAKEFAELKTKVIGISGGDENSKQKFCSENSLTVTLLSDPDFKVATAYESYGPKKFMGRVFKGIQRKTFILDQERKLIKIFDNVKAAGHSKEVLEYINSIR